MSDSWQELKQRIETVAEAQHADAEKIKKEFLEKLEDAKRDAIFDAINKLGIRVEELAARLPPEAEV